MLVLNFDAPAMNLAVNYSNFASRWQNRRQSLRIEGSTPSGLEVLQRAATLGQLEIEQRKAKDNEE